MEEKCCKCAAEANNQLVTTVLGKKVSEKWFCARHWVQNEGQGCLEFDLRNIERDKEYDSIDSEIVKEIWSQFPNLGKRFAKTLRAIVKFSEAHP